MIKGHRSTPLRKILSDKLTGLLLGCLKERLTVEL